MKRVLNGLCSRSVNTANSPSCLPLCPRRPRVAALCRGAVLGLVATMAWRVQATNHILRQDQLMAGFAGDPTIQFLVITVGGNDQKQWGPQPGEVASRAMLVFFNSNGVRTGTF